MEYIINFMENMVILFILYIANLIIIELHKEVEYSTIKYSTSL